MSFTRKIISLQFELAQGTFEGTSSNQITLSGLKVHLHMQQAMGVSSTAVQIVVWGLTPSQINQLATYGTIPYVTNRNQVIVSAGDEETGLSKIFQGIIQVANADYTNQPNVALVIEAYSNLYAAVAPAPSVTNSGQVSAAQLLGQLAAKWQPTPLTLENNGVTAMLTNQYLHGSVLDQIKTVARAANVYFYPDVINRVLAIWPLKGNRAGGPLEIGPTTGLVGYPTFGVLSISFTTLFNPNLAMAREVALTSSLKPANCTMTPLNVVTTLQSETPNGAWFQEVSGLVKGN